ncbi:MAG: hypothetical protein LBK94_12865 [Prevotellaceae bacterium]|jgi:hypothetical protein|nr:hypothetical protein [Prevotellaceae bacterium]
MNEEVSKYRGIVYLLALLVALPVIIYLLTFRKTLNTYIEYNNILDEIENLEASMINATEKIPEAVISQDYISNGLIIGYIKNTEGLHSDITIDKFIPSKIDLGNGLSVHTAQITVYSDYISIVKAIDNLEKMANRCNIVSVHFQSEKNRQTNNVRLKATIIIQQILEQ